MAEYDQRAYARGSHLGARVFVSVDGKEWLEAEASDISSGGLNMRSAQSYETGDRLWFDLVLSGFLSEFEVKTQGEVCRKEPAGGQYRYGIAFRGLSPEKRIQIDASVHNDRPVMREGYEAD